MRKVEERNIDTPNENTLEKVITPTQMMNMMTF
jgi:hypothetical protein